MHDLLVFFLSSKTIPIVVVYSVCSSIRPSSVEIVSFSGRPHSKSTMSIDLKFCKNVDCGVVHGRKEVGFQIRNPSFKFMREFE